MPETLVSGKSLKTLMEQRKPLWEKMEAIHKKAAGEKRSLTADERKEWTDLKSDFDELEENIRVAKEAEQVQLRMAEADYLARNPHMRGQMPSDARKGGDNSQQPAVNVERMQSPRGVEVRIYKPDEKIHLPQPAVNQWGEPERSFSFGDIAAAYFVRPRNEEEKRFLSEGIDADGGYTVPKVLGSEFIDLVRAKSQVIAAGARTVPMESNNLTLAKLLNDPVVAWREEGANVAETSASFGKVDWLARSLAAYIPVTRELLQDSVNMASILSDALAKAMAQELDRVCQYGTGVAPQPKGLVNYTGVQKITFNSPNGGVPANYDVIVDAYQKLLEVNATPTAAIHSPRTWGTFAKLKDNTGQPLVKPEAIRGLRMLETQKVPNNLVTGTSNDTSQIVVGDFTQLYIGVRQNIMLEVSNIPLLTKLQTVFVVHARFDVAAVRENHFVVINGIRA